MSEILAYAAALFEECLNWSGDLRRSGVEAEILVDLSREIANRFRPQSLALADETARSISYFIDGSEIKAFLKATGHGRVVTQPAVTASAAETKAEDKAPPHAADRCEENDHDRDPVGEVHRFSVEPGLPDPATLGHPRGRSSVG